MVFDLPIPGWLPETTTYGVEDVGIRYILFAEAKFTHVQDDSQSSGWSLAALCAPFRSRIKSTMTVKPVIVRRFVSPSEDPLDPSTSSTLTYLVNSPVAAYPDADKPRIPEEILSKIQVLASVPDYVDVDGDNFPLVIRMRTKDLESSECRRIQVTSVGANIIQREKCRCVFRSIYCTSHSYIFVDRARRQIIGDAILSLLPRNNHQMYPCAMPTP